MIEWESFFSFSFLLFLLQKEVYPYTVMPLAICCTRHIMYFCVLRGFPLVSSTISMPGSCGGSCKNDVLMSGLLRRGALYDSCICL